MTRERLAGKFASAAQIQAVEDYKLGIWREMGRRGARRRIEETGARDRSATLGLSDDAYRRAYAAGWDEEIDRLEARRA
jgi:hypothetical protein